SHWSQSDGSRYWGEAAGTAQRTASRNFPGCYSLECNQSLLCAGGEGDDDCGGTLGLELQSFEVTGPNDLERVLESARRYQPDELIVVEDPLTISLQKQVTDFADTNRLPAMYGLREFVQTGGLMAYGASLPDLRQRAAGYVDKILKGAKPEDLPIQQP